MWWPSPRQASLEQHDEGSIVVDGIELNQDTENVAAIRREVGMVFQHFNLFPHLSVLENCALPQIRARGASRDQADAQVNVLQDVQITKPLIHALELDDVRFDRLRHVI